MIWKKSVICFMMMIGLLFAGLPAAQSQAAEGTRLKMTLPSFPIQVNGQPVDNARLKYPFLLYKDITYMPLTWEMTRNLGLNAVWGDGGLSIRSEGGQRSGGWYGWTKERIPPDLSGSNAPGQSYAAAMPGFSLTVNDSYVVNGRETYPFLIWNDITYMPLTWAYAHDLLGLKLRWKAHQGLEIIGGQQQVLGRIYYDDAEYLYIYPALVTDKGRGNLKVKKTMDERPVWMSVEETDALGKRLLQEQNRPAGEPAALTEKEDGLYYEGIKLLPKEEITIDPVYAETAYISGLTGVVFPLGPEKTFLTVTKATAFDIGRSAYDRYSFLIQNGQARAVPELPQGPDRVIANPDGSYWLVSNGMSVMHGRIIPDSRKLALLTPQGDVRLANAELGDCAIIVPGADNPGIANMLDGEGKLLIYAHQISGDPQTIAERGYYLIDTSMRMTKVETLDPLAQETPDLPSYLDDWPIYMGIDGKLYFIRKNNELASLIRNNNGAASYTDHSVMWYDDQLLGGQ